jgi:hypothetical protein
MYVCMYVCDGKHFAKLWLLPPYALVCISGVRSNYVIASRLELLAQFYWTGDYGLYVCAWFLKMVVQVAVIQFTFHSQYN